MLFFQKKSNLPAERAVAVVALRRVGTFLLVRKRFFGGKPRHKRSIHNFFCLKKIFLESHGSWLFSLKKISSN